MGMLTLMVADPVSPATSPGMTSVAKSAVISMSAMFVG
jgi:hypothetical protein